MSHDENNPPDPLRKHNETTPERIGPYRILDILGEGGMGTVYLAEQKEPVRRRVALKVIKLGMDSKQVLHRFEAERQALAMMEHSNIAKVFEAGTTERGQPFFVMEHVRGIPLTEYCDQHKVSVEERIELFRQICSGVQHAHQKGIMHRDLKPSNVLVSVQEGKAVPKIIDFGLARATNHQLIQATSFTEQGTILGTPEYMSPEQASLGAEEVDTRTDVYSLGVLLYELLVGELPITRAELQQAGLGEMQRKIREDAPPKPSTRLSSQGEASEPAARQRATDTRSLLRRLRTDLDWVVMRAIDKDRSRRYATPAALAEDLQRHLEHAPVLAGPPSAGYRLRKWLRRYRRAVASYGAIALALLVGLASTLVVYTDARAKEREIRYITDPQLVTAYREQAEELWPPWPEQIPKMQAWIEEVEQLLTRLPDYEAALASISGELTQREELNHQYVRSLVLLLRELREGEEGPLADMQRRLSWARNIQRQSITQYQELWDRAIREVRESEIYGGLVLEPQLGLVPVGPDPVSGLQEFVHVYSSGRVESPIPERRDSDGHLVINEQAGIIFVLIPGGEFHIGAQKLYERDWNHDPLARSTEDPVTSGRLAPYFLSKYEINQAQWTRMTGFNPSNYWEATPAGGGPLHPVENVSWNECRQYLGRMGFNLPDEAEWEYARRAGDDSPWIADSKIRELGKYGNCADRSAIKIGASWPEIDQRIIDGHAVTAPIGSYAPNDFGLYDMLGNVSEWCRDALVSNPRRGIIGRGGKRRGDGLLFCPLRGGNYRSNFADTRSAARFLERKQHQRSTFGVRPMRPILK